VRSCTLGKQILRALGFPIKVAKGNTAVRKSGAMLNRDLLGWLDGRAPGRPFFAFVNYYDAHGPFIAPPPEGQGPDPRFGMGALPDAEKNAIIERYLISEEEHLAPGPERDRLMREATDVFRDSYESCLASLDRQVGLLFDELERRGLLGNTLVIVTSDHGEHFAERGFFGHGRSLYRPEVHIPLLIFDPSDPEPGRKVAEPVSLRDVAATAVAWADGPSRPSPFPGRSLTRFWNPEPGVDPATPPLLCELEQHTDLPRMAWVPSSLGMVRSLTAREHVYILSGDGREELYDVAGDPHESKNLAVEASAKPVMDRFREALDRITRE
jgi:arylsulfatase A-like enzyme